MRSAWHFLLVISKYFVWKNFKPCKITPYCYINICGQKQLPEIMFNFSSPAHLLLGLQKIYEKKLLLLSLLILQEREKMRGEK